MLKVPGGYLLGGESGSGISGCKTAPLRGGEGDFWLVKVDDSGTVQWDRSYGGDHEE
jgi:hypothetical protein